MIAQVRVLLRVYDVAIILGAIAAIGLLFLL